METVCKECVDAAKQADDAAEALQDCLESMTFGASAAMQQTIDAAARRCVATKAAQADAVSDCLMRQAEIVKRASAALEECEANMDLLNAHARAGAGPLDIDGLLHVELRGSFVAVCPDAVIEYARQCFLVSSDEIPDGEWDVVLFISTTYHQRGLIRYRAKPAAMLAKYVTVTVPDMLPGVSFAAHAHVYDIAYGLEIVYQFDLMSEPADGKSIYTTLQILYGRQLFSVTVPLWKSPASMLNWAMFPVGSEQWRHALPDDRDRTVVQRHAFFTRTALQPEKTMFIS